MIGPDQHLHNTTRVGERKRTRRQSPKLLCDLQNTTRGVTILWLTRRLEAVGSNNVAVGVRALKHRNYEKISRSREENTHAVHS
jgi:molybdenum cofactor biosynthesis enzyme MoaA